MRIVPLSHDNIDAAIALTMAQLPAQAAELEDVGEAPDMCMRQSLAYGSGDAGARAAAQAWGDKNGIDVRRLQYFVAQTSDGQLLGVSGVYGTKPPYLERMGIEPSDTTKRLQQPDQFWMAYTAIVSAAKGLGIGTKLMQHGMQRAEAIAKQEGIADPKWALLADPGAITYYEQFGMKPVLTHGEELVFETPLHEALKAIDAKGAGGMQRGGGQRTAPTPREGNWAQNA